MKAFALKALIWYGKVLLDLTVMVWLALSISYGYTAISRPLCDTIVRWDYIMPARVVGCQLPRVDIPSYIRQGIDYMSQKARE